MSSSGTRPTTSCRARGGVSATPRSPAGTVEASAGGVTAGEQAERGWAKEQAVALYREALELVTDEDAGRRGEIRRKLAVARQAHFHVLDARLLGLGPEEPA